MMDNERFITLVQRFIDEKIDEDEGAELLNAIEESSDLCETLRGQAAMHAVIARRFRRKMPGVSRRVAAALRDPSQKKGAITRIMEKLDPKRPQKKATAITPLPQPANRQPLDSRSSRRNFFLAAAAVAVTLLAPILLYKIFHRNVDDADELAWKLPANETVVVRANPSAEFILVRRNDVTLKLKKERALIAGDVITTFATNSVALTYPDSTVVSTSGETHFSIQPDALKDDAGIAIDLTLGEINAHVAAQPQGKPMVVSIPHGRVTIVGTEFKLTTNSSQARLEVSEGKVKIKGVKSAESVLVEKGHSAVLAAGVTLDPAPLERDPAYWPFSAQSPWNFPMGSGAKFVPVDSPHFDPTKGVELVANDYAIPIYIAAPGDPERGIYRRTKDDMKQLQMPANALPDPSEMKLMNVVDERHRKVYEFLGVNFESDGVIHLGYNSYYNTLTSMGVFSDNRQHGSRIYGGSSMGGIVRKGELSGGIRHALGIGVIMAALNANAPSGKAYVWPASNAIVEADAMYGKDGNLHLGTLLAIPSNVDLRNMGIGTQGPAYEIARALQDYGGYIIEHSMGGDHEIKLYFEPTANAEISSDLAAKLSIVMRYLKVVANNSMTNVGGGGAPRRQLAPPFKKEFLEKREGQPEF